MIVMLIIGSGCRRRATQLLCTTARRAKPAHPLSALQDTHLGNTQQRNRNQNIQGRCRAFQPNTSLTVPQSIKSATMEEPQPVVQQAQEVAPLAAAKGQSPAQDVAPGVTAAPQTPTSQAQGVPRTRPAATEGVFAEPGARRAQWAALSNASQTGYVALTLLYTAMALACLLLPALAARTLFSSKTASPLHNEHLQLLRLLGGALLAATGAAAALALAGTGDRARAQLGPRGADLLRLGLAGVGALIALTLVYYPATIRPFAFPLELVANGATAVLPAAHLLASGRMRTLPSDVNRWLGTRPTSLLAWAHLVLAASFPLSGAAFFFAPELAQRWFFGYAYGRSTSLLTKMAGAVDLTLIPAAHLALKDATEAGTLRSPHARAVAAGVALAGLVHKLVLLPLLADGRCGWMMPGNLATWAASTFICLVGLMDGGRRFRPVRPTKAKKRE